MKSFSQLSTQRRMRSFPSLGRAALACWILLLCIASQIPYYMVWAGQATFTYDAYTIFSPWNVSRLGALREGDGLLGFFHSGIPSDVWPSYFFSGAVRQFAALLQVNSASGHAVVQAIHLVLLVPATAGLIRSFGIPLRFGMVGGLLYSSAGIHVSLGQHVYSQEALLYLVTSLWALRVMLLQWPTRSRRHNLIVLLLCALSLVSLVRVHHEAILYIVPLALWTALHLGKVGINHGRQEAVAAMARTAAIGAFVALCSVPMLLTAYDLSLTNKTQPYSYADLHPYFSDFRVFLLALLLPGFAGKVEGGSGFPYDFGQDATLSYLFFGSLTIALFGVTVLSLVKQRKWTASLALVAGAIVLVAYTFGPGNPIHRVISSVFPFLVSIGHGYYGLHLLYLLAAFGVAAGLRELAEGRGLRDFVLLQLVTLAAVLYLALRAHVQGGWGIHGSFAEFGAVLQHDTRWLANATLAALAVVAAAAIARKSGRSPTATQRMSAAIVLIGLGGLVAVDVVKPTWNAHFVPGPGSALVQADPIGGFNLSTEVVEYFRSSTAHAQRPLRVLPLFQKPGGWRPNALLPLRVHLVHAPADSGGNVHVSQLLARPPDEAVIQEFIDDYGVDAFWASRWEMDAWQSALATSPRLQLAFRSEYGGDVYTVRQDTVPPTPGFRWNTNRPTISQGLVSRRWAFGPLPAASPTTDFSSLPLMWHPWYEVRLVDGTKLPYGTDDHGRVAIAGAPMTSKGLMIEYPGRGLSALVLASAAIYLAAVMALLLLVAFTARDAWRKRRPPAHAGGRSSS